MLKNQKGLFTHTHDDRKCIPYSTTTKYCALIFESKVQNVHSPSFNGHIGSSFQIEGNIQMKGKTYGCHAPCRNVQSSDCK